MRALQEERELTVLTAAVVLSLVAQYPDWDHDKAVWLASKESSLRADAINPAGPYYGLFQIGEAEGRAHGATPDQLLDPATNVRVAHALYQERGWQPWPVAAQYREEDSMIDAQGWFNWAQRLDGPDAKRWPDTNLIEGCVFHSAVGSLQGVANVVFGPVENQRSVTGAIGYTGHFVQFYPVTQSPWANGSREFNRRYLGFEFEGGRDMPATVSEPLTTEQQTAAIRILQDLTVFKGVGPNYWRRPSTLIEHRELVATACPSGRIPWAAIEAGLVAPPPAITVPSFRDQLDALGSVAQLVLDFEYKRPLLKLSPQQKQTFAWLADRVKDI